MAQQSASWRPTRAGDAPDYRRHLPWLVLAAALAGFIAAPWPLAEKAHAVLHGLCAQTPSHTFLLGGQPLPFDARMTGIYTGVLVTAGVLARRTRLQAAALPGWPLLGALVLLVGVMAVDGFNSLFRDLGMTYFYEPRNWLRLVTGAGAGIALGATLCYLIGGSVWRRPESERAVIAWRDLGVTALVWSGITVLILSGWGALYAPATLLLLLAAVATVCSIAYVMLILTRMTNNRLVSLGQIGGEGAVGILLGLAAIAVLACGRFALERWLGLAAPI